MFGITSYGAYIPRLRLSRKSIVQAIGWRAPIAGHGHGEKAMCNWDEDSLTMAVTAARDCLIGKDKSKIDAHYLASTSLPFTDRLNAVIASTALNLREDIASADFTSCQRAGTSALVAALEVLKGGEKKNILVTASDKRETKAACTPEMLYGDGAAAVLLGSEDVIAEFKGSYTVSCDFIDHYRGLQRQYDYSWEERWVRDEGYLKIIPQAIGGLLAKLHLSIDKVHKIAFACPVKRDHATVAKALGVVPGTVMDNMFDVCGETGTAHPLVMLAAALEQARPGELIIVAGFGQGSDALCFEVTENIVKLPKRVGVSGSLANRKATEDYIKYLVFRDLLLTESGIRSEAPTQTALTTLWRRRKTVLGFVGGKCRNCGTPQFPKLNICVNPECGAIDQFDDYEFADEPAVVKSFTGDNLAASLDPPAIFGMVQFQGGGRWLVDFADCELAALHVGQPVRMAFRKHVVDKDRGFTGYFWKAVPLIGDAEAESRPKAE